MCLDVIAEAWKSWVPSLRPWTTLEDDSEEIDNHSNAKDRDGSLACPFDPFANKYAQVQRQNCKFRDRTRNHINRRNNIQVPLAPESDFL